MRNALPTYDFRYLLFPLLWVALQSTLAHSAVGTDSCDEVLANVTAYCERQNSCRDIRDKCQWEACSEQRQACREWEDRVDALEEKLAECSRINGPNSPNCKEIRIQLEHENANRVCDAWHECLEDDKIRDYCGFTPVNSPFTNVNDCLEITERYLNLARKMFPECLANYDFVRCKSYQVIAVER